MDEPFIQLVDEPYEIYVDAAFTLGLEKGVQSKSPWRKDHAGAVAMANRLLEAVKDAITDLDDASGVVDPGEGETRAYEGTLAGLRRLVAEAEEV